MKKVLSLLIAATFASLVCVTAFAAEANSIDTEWNYCDITNFFAEDNENTVLTVVYDNSGASDPAGMNIGFKLEHTDWGTAVWPYFAADGTTGEITFTITRDELLKAGTEANGGAELGTIMWAQVENGSSGAKLVSVAYSAPASGDTAPDDITSDDTTNDDITSDDTTSDETNPEDTATDGAGNAGSETESDKGSPDTGVEDIAVAVGLAITAAGAIAVSRKRK